MFFVYVDWTTEVTPRPFYVGKGKKSRILDIAPRNPIHGAIAVKYGFRRDVVLCTQDEEFAFCIERQFILDLKTMVRVDGHWGANFTEGGEGTAGWKPSEEWRLAAGKRQKDRLSSPEARHLRSEQAKKDWSKRKAAGFKYHLKGNPRKPRPVDTDSTRNAKRIAGLRRWANIKSGLSLAPQITPEVRARLGSGKDKLRKSVVQLSPEGVRLQTFHSAREASVVTGIGDSHISECCHGKRKTAGGFIWVFQGESNG